MCDVFTANLKKQRSRPKTRGKVEPLDLHSLRDCPEHILSRPHTYTSGGNAQDHACTRLGSSVSRYIVREALRVRALPARPGCAMESRFPGGEISGIFSAEK